MSKTRVLCLVVPLVFSACGGSAPTPTPSKPVAETPLKGTIGGTDFVAKSAIASKGLDPAEPDNKFVTIYESARTCADRYSSTKERKILAGPEWKDGVTYDFSLQQNITFVTYEGSTAHNQVVTDGRLEVISAPKEKNAVGKIRLRGSAKGDSVEGQVDVSVCD